MPVHVGMCIEQVKLNTAALRVIDLCRQVRLEVEAVVEGGCQEVCAIKCGV